MELCAEHNSPYAPCRVIALWPTHRPKLRVVAGRRADGTGCGLCNERTDSPFCICRASDGASGLAGCTLDNSNGNETRSLSCTARNLCDLTCDELISDGAQEKVPTVHTSCCGVSAQLDMTCENECSGLVHWYSYDLRSLVTGARH